MSNFLKGTGSPRLLIIHAGADKCASSSLQSSLHELNKKNPELQQYQFLANKYLLKTDESKAEENYLYVKSIFEKRTSDTVILSNEGLIGESLPSLRILCKVALEDYNFDKVIITIYSRSASSHAISSYHQWFFRNHEILKSDARATAEMGLKSCLLTPLERRLLSIKFKKIQYVDWNAIIQNIKIQTSRYGNSVRIISNHIPTPKNNYALLVNFLETTGIISNYKNISLAKYNIRSNDRFAEELTHSLSIALYEGAHSDIYIPGPHEMNDLLMALTTTYKDCESLFEKNLNQAYINHRENLNYLGQAVDDISREGTIKYCKQFNLKTEQFLQPKKHNNEFDIRSILKVIEKRKIHAINMFNENCIAKLSIAYKNMFNTVPWMQFAKKCL